MISVIQRKLRFRLKRLIRRIARFEVERLEERFPELFMQRNARGHIFNPIEIRPCPCGYSLDQLPIRRDLFRCDQCGLMQTRKELDRWKGEVVA